MPSTRNKLSATNTRPIKQKKQQQQALLVPTRSVPSIALPLRLTRHTNIPAKLRVSHLRSKLLHLTTPHTHKNQILSTRLDSLRFTKTINHYTNIQHRHSNHIETMPQILHHSNGQTPYENQKLKSLNTRTAPEETETTPLLNPDTLTGVNLFTVLPSPTCSITCHQFETNCQQPTQDQSSRKSSRNKHYLSKMIPSPASHCPSA